MRLPWIQLTEDGDRRARSFGQLVGIGADAGVGFVGRLWRAALDLAPPGDFSGRFEDPAVLVAHAGGFPPGFPAEPARVVTELQRVGLVATTPFLRVRGLDRYEPTWRKNNKLPKSGSHPAETGGKPARKTETETEKKEDAGAPAAKTPRKPSAAQELFAWLNATRATKTPLSDSPIGAVLINTKFGEALTQHGRPTIERAYLAFLELAEPRAMDPPWPWQSFLKRLPMLATQPARPIAPKSRTLAPGEDPYAEQTA
jgi:hypothetical protein